MLFILSLILFLLSIFLNNGVVIVNEEFIILVVCVLSTVHLFILLRDSFLFYFAYQKEKVFYFFAYLYALNETLLDKIINFISAIPCLYIMHLIEIYVIFELLFRSAELSYNVLFGSLRYYFFDIFYFSSLPCILPFPKLKFKFKENAHLNLNLSMFFFLFWQKYIESV